MNLSRAAASSRSPRLWSALFFASLFCIGLGRPLLAGRADTAVPVPVTFNKDIAPIVFQHCATCHRPGQSAPFSLLTCADVTKRARQIAEVTASRFMPPWLPEPGYVEFANDRNLSAQQIDLFRRWVDGGSAEGRAEDLPPVPTWNDEWQLGRPDLIVQLSPPYQLQAEGRDVYRNVVIPIPIETKRYVKGVEFRPGNHQVMHHAFIHIDGTRLSRRLAEKEAPPGFDGMDLPETAHMPGGQLLGWQPGKQPSFSPPGLSWALEKNTDLVLQMHLNPRGRPELVQPRIGFFFTDQPPTNVAYRLRLEKFKFEIPPGEANYRVDQSYVLPVDVTALRILPHAHYLGKEMRVFAIRPDGTRQWLIHIKRWDFNWQGDYAYKTPIFLPKGTKVAMEFTYDNSSANVRNPHNPPQRVTFGLQSSDEMAACSIQVVPRNAQERQQLAEDFYLKFAEISLEYNRHLLQGNPTNALAHAKAGRALMALGDLDAAMRHFADALRTQPNFAKVYYDLGSIWLRQNRLREAERAFQAAAHYEPDDYQAYGSLAVICIKQGRLDLAEEHLRAAIRLNPDDAVSRSNLETVLRTKAGRK